MKPRQASVLLAGVLTVGCGGAHDPTAFDSALGGRYDGGCTGGGGEIVTAFDDPRLEAAVRGALGVGPDAPITCAHIAGLTELDASVFGIRELGGIEILTSLTQLALWSNSITDVTPLGALAELRSLSLRTNSVTNIEALRGLTKLRSLDLGNNGVTDISTLSGLTSLTWLGLEGNAVTDVDALRGLTDLTFLILRGNSDLSDIRALIDNVGLGSGDTVWLQSTSVSCADVDALELKEVTVQSDCS